jgi:hypothetical protein
VFCLPATCRSPFGCLYAVVWKIDCFNLSTHSFFCIQQELVGQAYLLIVLPFTAIRLGSANRTTMHSPLPDSSALEAGILEDETPSRLSRVQDNVRNLLRNSRFGSVASSPPTTPPGRQTNNGLPTPPDSPTGTWRMPPQPEVLPSPSAESSHSESTTTSPSSEALGDQIPAVHFAPAGIRHTLQQMAHQSALFNTRAVAALDHPDLSDPSLAVYVQQKVESRQRRAWTRSRSGRSKGGMAEVGSSQCLLCVLAALLLSAIVATCR